MLRLVNVKFVIIILIASSAKTHANTVKGDQTVGGIHFFEVHSTSGGMGLGVKILIALCIAVCLAYYCIRNRAKKYLRKTMLGNVLTSVTSTQPLAPQQLQAPQPAPQPEPYQLVVRPARRSRHHDRDYASDSEMSYVSRRQRRDRSAQ